MLRRTLKYTGISLAVGSGAGAVVYLASNDSQRQRMNMNMQASYRIANLLKTVASISADYAYVITFKSDLKDKYKAVSDLVDEIKLLQDKAETYTFEMWNTKDKKKLKELRSRIDENRLKINELSEKLANLRLADRNGDGGCDGQSWLSPIHRRSAQKLTKMCQQNKGVYIKLGQHIAMLDHVVPEEYREELSQLLSNNPHSKWESVRRIFYDEFGKYPEEMFDSIEFNPIASASLAQVHVAYRKGVKLAVKIQHEGLLEGSVADRFVITYVVSILSNIFEGFNYNWLTREMNKNLPMELNFLNERENIRKCSKYLKDLIDKGDVAVPTVFDDISSRKILTMKFEEGCYVSNKQAIADMKLNSHDIARLISITFFEQIFRHGFVHCDPHEANLLLRKHPTKPGRPQLVLLDHGLYKELDDNFRRNYCRLWRAIICSNEADIRKYCTNLNAGELFTILAAVLTMRSWDDITSDDINRLKRTNSAAESEQLRYYAQRYFKDIVRLLGNVPSELLLLLKTNDCLRHIDNELGSPINGATVIAAIASEVILKEDLTDSKTVVSYVNTLSRYMQVQVRLWGLFLAEYAIDLSSYFHRN